MLDKHFDAAAAEPRIYEKWEEAQAFRAGLPGRDDADPYCIVIPPPNVTGSLHMGHALNNTLQDILIRFERMRGKDVLWQPGTDHAGIATQMVVERQLAERGEPGRRELGREEFLKKVWSWKEESGGTILNQLKRLGASCDWSRERFTMDEGLSKAVLKVFVELYEKGLIYRGKRLVNWDPKFQTAISDLEVENTEVDGHMWHFKYPLAGGETYEYVEKDESGAVTLRETRDYISIATTRPETMLGDGAVAVHPTDERYAPIIGKLCEIPVGPKEHRRLIPIITDEYPDPEFGSGAVKITGAHDFNDYQVALRNQIPLYRLMDEHAAMRADGAPYAEAADAARALREAGEAPDEKYVDTINLVPDEYRGLDRFEARKKVIADIDSDGLMIMVEDKKVMQPFGDRSKVVIEPMLTDQWFCDAETLAKPAIDAVERGKTEFVPKNWEKTYFDWMRNIQPWCISRQLWWGHQIPVWYATRPDDYTKATNLLNFLEQQRDTIRTDEQFSIPKEAQVSWERVQICAVGFPEAVEKAKEFFPEGSSFYELEYEGYLPRKSHDGGGFRLKEDGSFEFGLIRDPDVLDTWFSSALWPFSTLGWPDETPELARYYKTDVLVTGFDIIFFWVARMMMMGLAFRADEDEQPEVPFHTVYIHALVRDEDGQKMSKSKGNVIDPLELIDDYGADALRFTLAAMAAQGRDIKLAKSRVEGYRNFVTKLWNAARFCEMNECKPRADFDPSGVTLTHNRWIVTAADACAGEVTTALEAYRFNEAAGSIYRFTWNLFCDWYLEFAKPFLNGDDDAAKSETRDTAAWALDRILTLLHPFAPFVTEDLWGQAADRSSMLVHASWPKQKSAAFADASEEMNWVIDAITAVRSVRAEMNVPPSAKLRLLAINPASTAASHVSRNDALLKRLARLETIETVNEMPAGAIQVLVGQDVFGLPVADVINLADERARLEREKKKLDDEITKIDKKLANEKFLSQAPEKVVAEQRERKIDAEGKREKIAQSLSRLETLQAS